MSILRQIMIDPYAEYKEDLVILAEGGYMSSYDKRFKPLLLEVVGTVFLGLKGRKPKKPTAHLINLVKDAFLFSTVFPTMIGKVHKFMTLSSTNPPYADLAFRFARYILYTEWNYTFPNS